MKKFLIAGAAIAMSATPALADNSLVYNLDADVGSICGVYNYQGQAVPVAFGDLAATPDTATVQVGAGSASYRCNSAAGFSRTISSTNGGKLVRTGSNGDTNNSIAFEMKHGGGSGLGFDWSNLSSNKVNSFNGSAAFLSGQTGSVSFRVNGVYNINPGANEAPGTTVFAGDYTDTVTISVTAN